MKKSLLFSVALASAMSVSAQQVNSVAPATVSEAEVVAPMSQRVSEVKAADASREIAFGYAKAQAKAAGLKAVTGPAKAFYSRQKGLTYAGMSAGSYALKSSRMHVLPYQDFTLTSLSTEPETLTWIVSDGFTTDETGAIDGWTVKEFSGETVTWRHDEMSSIHLCPALEAANSLGDSTYQAADYITNLPYVASSTEGIGNFYKTNVNPVADNVAYWGVSACNSADANASLVSKYGLTEDKGFTDVNLYGLGEVFYYPGKPYLLTDAAAFVCDLVMDGNLNAKLEIYKVSFDENDDIVIGDLLTTATNDPSVIASGRQFQCVVFNDLVYTDPVTQRASDLVIDSDILVVVKPADEATSYASYIWATTEDFPAKVSDLWNDVCTPYLMAGAKHNGSDVVIPIPAATAFYNDKDPSKLDVQRSFTIEINAHYYYLHSEDDTFNAPVEGGEKTFTFDSWYSSAAWDVMTADEEDVPEWITISANDINEGEGYTGVTEVKFEVEALPAGVEGRACDVVLSYYGASATIHITQGNTGVEGVEVSAAKVSNVNGNFVVSCDNATEVSIYNAAGSLVKTAAINGESVIDAQNLANGMYILKFNNNVIVKAVK